MTGEKSVKKVYKGYVDTPEGQIHYHRSGQGEPFVLVHCTSDSSTMWDNMLPILGDLGYMAIAFDLPGHGNSDPPLQQPDGSWYARRVNEAAQLLGINAYNLMGHHFGASVAMWIASNHPEHVKKLILFGFPLIDEENRTKMAKAAPRVWDMEGNLIREQWINRRKISENGLPEGTGKFNMDWALRAMIARLQAGPKWYYAYHVIARTDYVALAQKIQAPTLIMSGPRDHFWKGNTVEEESLSAPKLFKNGQYAIIKDAGVDAADEYPEEFCRIIDNYIRNKV